MPRPKKQVLKARKDGRFACKYHGRFFYADSSDEALALREAYIKAEALGIGTDSPTVYEFASKWLPASMPSAAQSSYKQACTIMEKLTRAIGSMQVKDVLPSDIKSVYSTGFAGMSSSYILHAKRMYVHLFDAAVADGIITRNPAADRSAAPHRGTKGGHRAITAQERQWINTLCLDHRARPAIMAMLYEGIRPQEAKALDITRDVDRQAGVLRITHCVHLKDGNHYEVNTTGKTPKSTREIPLFSPFLDAISGKQGPLVTSADGSPLTITAWDRQYESYVSDMERAINGMPKRWYRKTKAHKAILAEAQRLREKGLLHEAAAKEAEIPAWIPFTVKPYDLRHSFVTACRDHGVELNTVVAWMGHTDATMVLHIYDEVTAQRSQTEAQKLQNADDW